MKTPAIPSSTFDLELVPGSIKQVKTLNRRADAMSWMDPHMIRVMDGFNARIRTEDYLAHMRAIADSMKAEGFWVNKPISVVVMREGMDNVVYVAGGHTRLEAALLAIEEGADFTEIPVIFLPKSTSMIDLTVDIYRDNNTSRPLTALETAVIAKRLSRMGLTESAIGERMGLAQSHVNGLLLLAGAPRSIMDMVAADEVSASEAIKVMRQHGGNAIAVLKQAKETAAEAGKSKVTASMLPGALFRRLVKKSAPKLLSAAREIAADPGYASLLPSSRERLDALLAELDNADDAQPDASAETQNDSHELFD